MKNIFFEQLQQDLWMLGNNHYYGLNTETFEERGNELLHLLTFQMHNIS